MTSLKLHFSTLLFIVLVSLALISPANSAVWNIVYPRSEIENDVRYEFPIELLELALQKTGVRYELKPSLQPFKQAIAAKRLEENLELNVMWVMTDTQREEQLRPIRIPIAKGLLGVRVLVTHPDRPFYKANITNLSNLLLFSPVQATSWPDTKILQANGFNVVIARDYYDSAAILEKTQADFFPRSIVEVYGELERESERGFKIKPGLVLAYPTAQYFFTNKRNITLSKLIETGLNRAIEDGSYDELFLKHYAKLLETIENDDTIKFDLTNPLLPPLTPISNDKLWYFKTTNSKQK